MTLKPKNLFQTDYIRTIAENRIILAHGVAGTGKSLIPIAMACEKLIAGEIERIVITKPFVNAGKGIGHLKGDLKEKCQPYFFSCLDEIEKYFDKKTIEEYQKNKKIILEPLELMRGNNYYNAFMIMTEAQNATKTQIRMFVTRLAKNSKCVLEGDVNQCDLSQYGKGCDFIKFIKHFQNRYIENIATIELPIEGIVRSKIIGTFVRETDEL